ncbi:hypothetical protein KM043_016124 [Ampulex compressa]|nr:hypothetical protein KM043_016124 [Ampulex compressa]
MFRSQHRNLGITDYAQGLVLGSRDAGNSCEALEHRALLTFRQRNGRVYDTGVNGYDSWSEGGKDIDMDALQRLTKAVTLGLGTSLLACAIKPQRDRAENGR